MNSTHSGRGTQRSEPSVPSLDATRFELLEEIGSGGMGTVYRALQRSVGRYVAVKMLSPEHAANASGLSRFVREANIIARLTHPNLVQLIDFGRDAEGNMLLVMELLEGESLRSLLRREGRLAPERAAYITVQCLNALRATHAAGVVHRDLKPENIFLHRAGDDDHVKVLDFGVAKLTESEAQENTTQGSLVGTLRYMAPEQVAGEGRDGRVDTYALGMVLYEMLSGQMPYDTRDRYVLLRQIIAEPPAHLLSRAPDLSPDLAAVVMHAIEKGARDRFQTADDFRKALTPFLAADHARLQALADATARPSQVGGTPGGEIRSGIVRSGQVLHVPTGGAQASSPPAVVSGAGPAMFPVAPPATYPSAPGYPSTPGYALPQGPQTAAAPPRRSVAVPVLLGVLAVLLTAVMALLALRRDPAPAPTAAAPVAPAQPVAQTPPPPPPSRMVLVSTTPAGARVIDSSGQTLCPETPCAVPVPVGRALPIRLVRGDVSLNVALDGASPHVTLDLAPLAQNAAPPAAGTTPPPRAPRGPARTPRRGEPRDNEGGDLPMFLPH